MQITNGLLLSDHDGIFLATVKLRGTVHSELNSGSESKEHNDLALFFTNDFVMCRITGNVKYI